MIVLKYGGSSVANIEKIKEVAKYISLRFCYGEKVVVVASAMAGVTDSLLNLTREIDETKTREVDQVISTGENQVVGLLALALNKLKIKAVSLTGTQIGIITNENHTNAFINKVKIKKIKDLFKTYQVIVVAGFQGVTKQNDITTLGKGGSDTTAVALAGALKCSCEIYTDVQGIFTTDPKIFPKAKKVKELSYNELMEMSASGAKVMETRSVEIAKKFAVPLYVGKSLESKKEGTYVMEKIKNFEYMPIKNITTKDDVVVVKLLVKNTKNLPIIFTELSLNYQKIELLSLLTFKNKKLIKFTISKQNCKKIIKNIKNKLKINKNNLIIEKNITKVTLTGSGLATHSLITKEVIEELNNNKIEFSNLTVSEISIGFTVSSSNKNLVVKILCKKFKL